MENKLFIGAGIIVALIIGLMIGYFIMPTKTIVKTEVKTIEVVGKCIIPECKPIIIRDKTICAEIKGFNELRQIQQDVKKAVDPAKHNVYSSPKIKQTRQLYAGPGQSIR